MGVLGVLVLVVQLTVQLLLLIQVAWVALLKLDHPLVHLGAVGLPYYLQSFMYGSRRSLTCRCI